MKTSKRRPVGLAAMTAGLLFLASCASTGEEAASEQTPDGGTTSTGAEAGGGTADAAAQPVASCEVPPELPQAPPTFGQEDAPTEAPPATLYATITTNCGDIEVELYGEQAPVTVASFANLSEHGYWNDSPCHRLTTAGIYVLQCGDPTGTGRGGPGYTFGIENAPADGQYPRGTLAMARAQDPNSNGGQYFIVYDDTQLPTQGGGYSIFGTVVDGMDVVDLIADEGTRQGTSDGAPAQGISVMSVEISEEKASESD